MLFRRCSLLETVESKNYKHTRACMEEKPWSASIPCISRMDLVADYLNCEVLAVSTQTPSKAPLELGTAGQANDANEGMYCLLSSRSSLPGHVRHRCFFIIATRLEKIVIDAFWIFCSDLLHSSSCIFCSISMSFCCL